MTKKGTSHKSELASLKRIEGQMRGIQKMIEEERYCPEILNAIAAVQGGLRRVELTILKNYLDVCARKAFYSSSRKVKEETLQEVYELLENLKR